MRSHIAAAWKLTTTADLIKKFNFIPSFFDTLVLSITLLWQSAYLTVDILNRENEFFLAIRDIGFGLFESGRGIQVVSTILLIVLIYVLFQFVLRNVFSGGLIHLIRAYFLRKPSQYKVLPALSKGIKSCLVLIEYQALFAWANVMYVLYIFIWGQRFLGGEYWGVVIVVAIIYIIIITVFAILFAYTRFFIVLEEKSLFSALGSSMEMSISHLDTTLQLFVSLILVYVRIIIVVVAILLLPSIVSGIIALNLAQIWVTLSFVVIGLVYSVFLVIVAHINSILEIFIETLWFSFYMENKYLDKDS